MSFKPNGKTYKSSRYEEFKQTLSHSVYIHLLFNFFKVLLWQVSVATNPLIFVIATFSRSVLIIYLLVSCNKQLFSRMREARHLTCLYTFHLFLHFSATRCVKTKKMSRPTDSLRKLLITTYQEVNDQH